MAKLKQTPYPKVMHLQGLGWSSRLATHHDRHRFQDWCAGDTNLRFSQPLAAQHMDALLYPQEGKTLVVRHHGQDLGFCAYRLIDWKNRFATLLWALPAQRNSLELEIVQALTRFAFLELGMNRVECETLAPRGAAPQAAGFVREVVKRHAARHNNVFCDLELWGKLRDEDT